MSLQIEKGEGPKTGMGSALRRNDKDFALRPSVADTREKLMKVLEGFSSKTIEDITNAIEEARKKVGDDTGAIADLLEEGARARTEAGKALKQGDLTLQQVADAIRNSKKPIN